MGALFPVTEGYSDGHEDLAVGRLITFEILSAVLQLLSIVFNGAILCTLCRRSLLKYPSNRFVFSLCLSHLTVSILSVTISLISTFLPSPNLALHKGSYYVNKDGIRSHPWEGAGHIENDAVQCSPSGVDLAHLIMMHLNFGVAVCTSITVALISAERYITIARPMRYKSIVTARRSMYAIICCWFLVAVITMMPLLLFENRHPVCGTFSVPMESLATYFGIVFSVVTLFALAVMIVCYTHIFRIAKAKCQKVQIGHFTASTVSSISSDWPSSAYSSAQGHSRFIHAGSRIESSNSLLHWVLMTNLGRHAQPRSVPNALRGGVPRTPPATPTLPPKNAFFSESALNSRRESDETTTTGTGSRNGSTSSSNSGGGGGGPANSSSYFIDPSRSPLFQYQPSPRKLRNRWKTYLQPNYNSPRKTIFTIVILIGAVLFTQLPLSFVLFTSTVEATQRWFQFCTTVLFSTSSVANPVLYGFLNRSIRDQLWRLLKRKSRSGAEHGPSIASIRKRKRCQQQQQLEELAQNPILSPASQTHLQSICRGDAKGRGGKAMEIPAIKISRRESISSDDNSSVQSVASTNSVNIIGTCHPGAPCYDLTRVDNEFPTQFCQDVRHVRAVGAEPIFFPEHVGLPLSENEDEYYMLQMHYDNPEQIAGIKLQFSLEAYYTDELRHHDGGMISFGVGTQGASSILIPPGDPNHVIYGHCAPDCTRKLIPETGINIFAVMLHTHQTGKGRRVLRIHDLQETAIIKDDNFDPNFQQNRILLDEQTILPGDMIVNRCIYDTSNRTRATVGGFKRQEEMCNSLLWYYPLIRSEAFGACSSEIRSDAYRNLLQIFDSDWSNTRIEEVVKSPQNIAGLTVSEVASRIDWNINRRAELQAHHRFLPQISVCPSFGPEAVTRQLLSVGQIPKDDKFLLKTYSQSLETRNPAHFSYLNKEIQNPENEFVSLWPKDLQFYRPRSVCPAM